MATNKDKIRAAAQKFLQKGQIDKAIREFQRLVEADPRDVRTLLKIGDLQTRKRDYKAATETYAQVAEFYSGQGFYLKAVAVYKQILKLDPTLVEINVKLAELYHQLGLVSDATNQYRQISQIYEKEGRVDDSLQVLRKMVELDSDNVASRIKLAELLAKAGAADDARSEFHKAATYLKSSHRIDDYVKVAERIVHFDNSDIETARELANIYVQKGDARRALAKLQICFRADPKDVETLNLLADAFKSLGQIPKTVSVFRELLRIHKEAGRQQALVVVARKILQLVPDDAQANEIVTGSAPPLVSGVGVARVQVVQKTLRPPGKVTEVNQVGDARTDDPAGPAQTMQPELEPVVEADVEPEAETGGTSAQELAKLLVETDIYVKYGLKPKALEHIRKVLELAPQHREANAKYKDLLSATGDNDTAVETLYAMALTARDNGSVDDAIGDLEEALSFDPAHEASRALLEELSPGAVSEAVADVEIDIDEEEMDVDIETDDEAAPSQDEVDVEVEVETFAQDPGQDEPEVEVEVELDVEPQIETEGVFEEVAEIEIEAAFEEEEPQIETEEVFEEEADIEVEATFEEEEPQIETEEVFEEEADIEVEATFEEEEEPQIETEEVFEEEEPEAEPVAASPEPSVVSGESEMTMRPMRPSELSGVHLGDPDKDQIPQSGSTSSPFEPPPQQIRAEAGSSEIRFEKSSDVDEPEVGTVAGQPEPIEERAEPIPSAPMVMPPELEKPRVASLDVDIPSYADLDSQPEADAPFSDAQPPAAEQEIPAAPAAAAPATSQIKGIEDLDALLADAVPAGRAVKPSAPIDDNEGYEGESTPPPAPSGLPAAAQQAAAALAAEEAALPEPEPELPEPAENVHVAPSEPEPVAEPPAVDLSDELEEVSFFLEQGLDDDAVEALNGLLEQYPDHPELLAAKAKLDGDASAPPAEPELEAEPEPELEIDGEVDLATALADDFSDLGDDDDFQISFQDVFDEFKKGVAQQVDDSDFETHYDLGIAYREMGLLEDAVREFSVAMNSPDKKVPALTMVGLCQLQLGRVDDALQTFLSGLNDDAVSANEAVSLRYEVGRAFESMGKLDDAVKFYEKAHSMDQSFRDVSQRLANVKAAGAQSEGASAFDQLLEETAAESAASSKISYV